MPTGSISLGENYHMQARLQVEVSVSDAATLDCAREVEFVSLGVEEDIWLICVSLEAED